MFDGARQLVASFHPLQKVGKLELESCYACGLGLVTQFPRLGERPCGSVIITPYASRIHRPAEYLVHRQVHRLAANVPQRLINTGDRRAKHWAAAIKAADIHQLPQMLDLHRIAADNEILKVHYAGHSGRGFTFESGFSPADYALVGLEFHEHVRPVGLGDTLIESDAKYLHVGNSQLRA